MYDINILINDYSKIYQWRIQGGGGGALFSPIILKSPLHWLTFTPKNLGTPGTPLSSDPGSATVYTPLCLKPAWWQTHTVFFSILLVSSTATSKNSVHFMIKAWMYFAWEIQTTIVRTTCDKWWGHPTQIVIVMKSFFIWFLSLLGVILKKYTKCIERNI